MTDPTPTRAEVERLRLIYGNITASPSGPYVRFTDYQALRERAEAAEKERDEALEGERGFRRKNDDLHTLLTAARRAGAAAWKDAIELAAKVADAQAWAHGGVHFNGPEQNSARIAQAIRALRRAAPTEDR